MVRKLLDPEVGLHSRNPPHPIDAACPASAVPCRATPSQCRAFVSAAAVGYSVLTAFDRSLQNEENHENARQQLRELAAINGTLRDNEV